MVKFLLNRPIATVMSFIALFLLGLVSYQRLPISLLPDIAIPEVTVRAYHPQYAAREMENRVANSLRRTLQQCTGLRDVKSESNNGQVTVKLLFEHGTDIDLAAIEVNEKIDRLTSRLPEGMDRPVVIKASATDIPVFYLNLSYGNANNSRQDFLELSRFANQVIKKRLEQIREVGFVDVTGIEKPQVSITPDMEKLKGYGVTLDYLQDVIGANNFSVGSVIVNEGYYQYHIRVATPLISIDEIKEIYIRVEGRLMKLKDLAKVELTAAKRTGIFMDGDKLAISLAIIKQGNAKMQDLKRKIDEEMVRLTSDFPDIQFHIAQDQSTLLEYSIDNLKQTVLYGAFLAFIVLFLFIPNWRLPLLMGITVPLSLVISILFLMLFDITINIISLSGLVLGIGLMIDNAIIVLDNISQHLEHKKSIFQACADATNEVIRPLLSSALTTSAVFVPLIFISGITGALFYDQAITVTISLIVSFAVSITLLPVIFRVTHGKKRSPAAKHRSERFIRRIVAWYEAGFRYVFGRKVLFTFLFLGLMPLSWFLFQLVDKQTFPEMTQDAVMVDVSWNENLSPDEMKRRIQTVYKEVREKVTNYNAWSGAQDYLLSNDYELRHEQARLYIQAPRDLREIKQSVRKVVEGQYPYAEITFSEPKNLFSQTFEESKAPMILMLYPKHTELANDSLLQVLDRLEQTVGKKRLNALGQYRFIRLAFDREKLLLYNIKEQELVTTLKTAFNENNIATLNTTHEVIPILIGSERVSLRGLLETTQVSNSKGILVSLKHFLTVTEEQDFEVIYGSEKGTYIPAYFAARADERMHIEDEVSAYLKQSGIPLTASWEGGLYDFENNIREIAVILLVSIALLYFILAIQFESLLQPLIILLEIPMDLSGALLVLLLFGSSLNVMSAIGIVVMTGIIINDSILKLDTINTLHRKDGLPLLEAIRVGGERRIRPILMTSATTILALAPFLVGDGLGTELQLPLALTVIGGLGLGTIVSLYFIPLCYWWINSRREHKSFSGNE